MEEIDGDYVNTAMDRLVKNDVHYRYGPPFVQVVYLIGALLLSVFPHAAFCP